MTSVVDREAAQSGRIAPHSAEAEESVLGAMMISSEAADIALAKLHPEDFYRPAHQSIFAAIVELFDGNKPIDFITITERLRATSALDRVGGVSYVTTLSNSVPTASNIEHYIGIVEEHALRRRLLRAGGEVGNLAMTMDQPISDVLDTAEQRIYAVSERRVGEGLAPIDPLLFPAIEKAEQLSQRGSEITGLATGFRDLDRKLAGLHPGNLFIVAARPGMGKTALALCIAKNVAMHDVPVAIFSLEMSREEVVSRLLCAQGRIDSQKLRTGQLNESDFGKLSNAASAIYHKPVYVDDSPGMTVTEIRAKCRRLSRRPGLGLVVVDYLQLMHSPGSAENRQQEIATISRNLKNLARELHVPVVAVSQLNRSLESREDKRPRLGDLRESGAIEQDADVVAFIYRHEYYNPEAIETKGLAEVQIAKHRQGATGKIDMTFMPEYTLFADMGREPSVAV